MNILHIVSIICFAFCLVMFFYLKWYVKKRTSAATGLEERREEVLKLIHEIDRITDRDSQLVEERIKKLKEILDEAESRIALYVKEFDKRKTGEALYTSLGRGIRAALETPKAPLKEIPEIKPDKETQQPVKISKKQIRAHIDILVNEGHSAQEIAQRLGISIAEVNLALELQKPKIN